MALLKATGLSKSFEGLRAVDDVDLTVDAGQCLALLGPNGEGKSTTIEMLLGLIKPDLGEILLFGESLAANRRKILDRIGVQLQVTDLYKRYTVTETLELFASFYSRSKPIDELLKTLRLEDKAGTQLRKLSGGQKQRVYLGCCLINDPEILFLDEPTTGLDPQARAYIWDVLVEAKSLGKGTLLTTHYMDEAEKLADLVVIMDQGKVIAKGSPQELIQSHIGNQICRFRVAGMDDLPDFLADMTDMRQVAGAWELTSEHMAKDLAPLFSKCAEAGVEIEDLAMRSPTLEDVFLKLTGRGIRDES